MRSSTSSFLMAAVLLVGSVIGLHTMYDWITHVPQALVTHAGVAKVLEVRPSPRALVRFQLARDNGAVVEYAYGAMSPGYHRFVERLRDGMRVEVLTDPERDTHLWGLKLESEVLLTPRRAREYLVYQGILGIALGVVMLALALGAFRFGRKMLRHGD